MTKIILSIIVIGIGIAATVFGLLLLIESVKETQALEPIAYTKKNSLQDLFFKSAKDFNMAAQINDVPKMIECHNKCKYLLKQQKSS